MENEETKKTALETSVGADERQSAQSNNSIPEKAPEINDSNDFTSMTFEQIQEEMRKMSDPAYLHTISMNELYENVYQSRPPVIDGLLYSGTYLFAGAPKVGKSFFMAQLAYHVSTGKKLWDYEVRQGTVLYLAWRTTTSVCKNACPVCSAWRAPTICISPYMPSSWALGWMSS